MGKLNSNIKLSRFLKISFTKNFSITGHSLSGIIATKYVNEHININGVIFYASYLKDDTQKKFCCISNFYLCIFRLCCLLR